MLTPQNSGYVPVSKYRVLVQYTSYLFSAWTSMQYPSKDLKNYYAVPV